MLQLILVAEIYIFADTELSKKTKLLAKLKSAPANFTWDEAVKLMGACGFKVLNRAGSGRMFVHANGTKVRLHEPHPRNTLLPYMVDCLLEGLKAAGELD